MLEHRWCRSGSGQAPHTGLNVRESYKHVKKNVLMTKCIGGPQNLIAFSRPIDMFDWFGDQPAPTGGEPTDAEAVKSVDTLRSGCLPSDSATD